jgi:hypothetical protein
MMLMTRLRSIVRLVEEAVRLAQLTEDEVLVAWNARVRLLEGTVIMESACPIFLEQVLEQLKIFTGRAALKPGRFFWMHVRRRPGPRPWRLGQEARCRRLDPASAPSGTPLR